MLLQSLLRPVLTPLMRGMFDAPIASSSAWSPMSLWPDGILSPGMWISPRDLTSEWADYTGTTPVATPGTVADSSNPVGLALDIRAGATVLTDPGLHMLQSTSAARPLMSARVNLLTHTNDFADATWTDYEVTLTENATTAPDGTTTACKIAESSGTGQHVFHRVSNDISMTAGAPVTQSWYMKDDGVQYVLVTLSSAYWYASATFDIVSGSFVRSNYIASSTYISGSAEVTPLGSGWYRVSASFMPTVTETGYVVIKLNRPNINTQDPSYAGDGVSGVYVWHPQIEFGSTATAYQEVITAADYATALPVFQLYDGVDDGMATAAFTAGTLIDGMDCMIVVRRDSAAACVAGLYNGIADATKFFGMAESGSGSGGVGSGAGTPTVWVDGTQLAGGTAVTRGTLHTALTVGDVHILEFRGLDLSTWTSSGFGLYTGYLLNGPRGDILLYPSTASTTDKDAARQWLADYYGVTLP
jgi:hypothetical protein